MGRHPQVFVRSLEPEDCPSHTAGETAIGDYVRWRNNSPSPKRHIAIDSKIRRPDYYPTLLDEGN